MPTKEQISPICILQWNASKIVCHKKYIVSEINCTVTKSCKL